jgi:hypothetical protein
VRPEKVAVEAAAAAAEVSVEASKEEVAFRVMASDVNEGSGLTIDAENPVGLTDIDGTEVAPCTLAGLVTVFWPMVAVVDAKRLDVKLPVEEDGPPSAIEEGVFGLVDGNNSSVKVLVDGAIVLWELGVVLIVLDVVTVGETSESS